MVELKIGFAVQLPNADAEKISISIIANKYYLQLLDNKGEFFEKRCHVHRPHEYQREKSGCFFEIWPKYDQIFINDMWKFDVFNCDYTKLRL